jgi:hypothetical protein
MGVGERLRNTTLSRGPTRHVPAGGICFDCFESVTSLENFKMDSEPKVVGFCLRVAFQ